MSPIINQSEAYNIYTSYYLIRHSELRRCKKVHMDAGLSMLSFASANFQRVHSPPTHPLRPFFFSLKVCTRGTSETCYRSPTLISRLANDRCPLVLNATPLPSERLAVVRKYGDLSSPHQSLHPL